MNIIQCSKNMKKYSLALFLFQSLFFFTLNTPVNIFTFAKLHNKIDMVSSFHQINQSAYSSDIPQQNQYADFSSNSSQSLAFLQFFLLVYLNSHFLIILLIKCFSYTSICSLSYYFPYVKSIFEVNSRLWTFIIYKVPLNLQDVHIILFIIQNIFRVLLHFAFD